jgi:dephospho-CoA kinase
LEREGRLVDFEAQDQHAVEQQTSRLYELARDVVDNQGDLEELFRKLDRIVHRDWRS